MASNPGQSSQSMLVTNLDQLKKLIDEVSVKHDGGFLRENPEDRLDILLEEEREARKHATEISNILLWIATHHPEVLKDEAEELRDVFVKRLYFLNSWEFPDELVPTDALTTLLNSSVCRDMQTFCGYVNTQVLKKFPKQMIQLRLALGRHIDVGSIIEELNCRQKYLTNVQGQIISIHLRCGDVDLKDLAPLPGLYPKVYISDVSDHDAAWVVQATVALANKEPCLDALHLPRSKVTSAGVEAIAKGIFDAGIFLGNFGVSSPNIDNDSEESSDFSGMISDKYNIEIMDFGDEDSLEFTNFTDYIPDDSTVDDIVRVLKEMSHQNSSSTEELDDITDVDLADEFVRVMEKVMQEMDDSRDGLNDDSDDDLPDLLE